MQRLRAKAEEDRRRKEAQDAEEAERKRKELVVLAEQAADERRRCMEQQIEATRRRAEKEAAEAEAERLREESEAERLREYDAKRRRAAEADEAAQTSQREAKAALEAERLRAKLEKEHLRFVRDAEDEQARSDRVRTEDKSSVLLQQSLDLMAKSHKELEKADQLRARAKARFDRKVAREKLVAENVGRGMSHVDIDTSDDSDFEATVRLSGEVQKLEATGWIEQIRSMWLHQLC